MPHVQQAQFERSKEQLAGFEPLLLVTIPALLQGNVPLVETQAEADAQPPDGPAIRGALERDFLRAHFAFPGGPPGKPFFLPTSQWVNSDFHSSSLQAQRSERLGTTFFKSGPRSNSRYYPAGTDWQDFASRLSSPVRTLLKKDEAGNVILVPLFDLASWLYRDVDVASPEALLAHAVTTLSIPAELMGLLFSDAIPADAAAIALGVEPMDDEAIAAVLGVRAPPPAAPASVGDLVGQIETSLGEQQLELAAGVVHSIVLAWLARDIVILVGAPGTGKSTLASAIAQALSGFVPDERFAKVVVGEDWTSAELIGYENLAGAFVPRTLSAKILQSQSPTFPHIVLLEECNLSKLEHYMSAVLHAVEDQIPTITLPGTQDGYLPVDTLIIGTCNSPRDEPASRIAFSSPSIQRMSIIEMPNILATSYDRDGDAGIKRVATKILRIEARAIRSRDTQGAGTWLDSLRTSKLGASPKVEDFTAEALTAMTALVKGLLGTNEGRRWMTMRPLRDIVVHLYLTEASQQLGELTSIVRTKLIHLVREAKTFEAILEACKDLPGIEDLRKAVSSMMTEQGDVAPLV